MVPLSNINEPRLLNPRNEGRSSPKKSNKSKMSLPLKYFNQFEPKTQLESLDCFFAGNLEAELFFIHSRATTLLKNHNEPVRKKILFKG